jgi:hypothetical protein
MRVRLADCDRVVWCHLGGRTTLCERERDPPVGIDERGPKQLSKLTLQVAHRPWPHVGKWRDSESNRGHHRFHGRALKFNGSLWSLPTPAG